MTDKAIPITDETIDEVTRLRGGNRPNEMHLNNDMYLLYEESEEGTVYKDREMIVHKNVFDRSFEFDEDLGPGSIKPKH